MRCVPCDWAVGRGRVDSQIDWFVNKSQYYGFQNFKILFFLVFWIHSINDSSLQTNLNWKILLFHCHCASQCWPHIIIRTLYWKCYCCLAVSLFTCNNLGLVVLGLKVLWRKVLFRIIVFIFTCLDLGEETVSKWLPFRNNWRHQDPDCDVSRCLWWNFCQYVYHPHHNLIQCERLQSGFAL